MARKSKQSTPPAEVLDDTEPFEDGQTAATVEIVYTYTIREWRNAYGTPKFDWVDQGGGDSFALFDSIEEAEADIRLQ